MRSRDPLRIKRHYSLVAHSPDVVELRYGVWNPVSFTLTDESGSGRLFSLLTRLDGSRSVSQVAREARVPRSQVESLLDHLVELGVVEGSSSNPLDHYLDDMVPNLRVHEAEAPGGRTPVTLLGDRGLCQQIAGFLADSLPEGERSIVEAEDPARRILSGRDVSWLFDGHEFEARAGRFEPWRNHLVVFAMKVINPIELRAFNRISLRHRITWLHAALDGPFLLVGPTFLPSRSACHECLETRVLMNLREAASYQRYKRALVEGQIRHGPAPVESVLSGMLASHTAFEALNYLLTGTCYTIGKMLTVYLPTMEISFNEVLRLPGCTACSPTPERDDEELYFALRGLVNGGPTPSPGEPTGGIG